MGMQGVSISLPFYLELAVQPRKENREEFLWRELGA